MTTTSPPPAGLSIPRAGRLLIIVLLPAAIYWTSSTAAAQPGSFVTGVTLQVGDGPSIVQVGDMDADGDSDLVVLNVLSDDLSVLLGDGTGSFRNEVRYRIGGDVLEFLRVYGS